MPTATTSADIAVLGAGPTGLYGAYCAGFRGLSTVLIDSFPTVGGQVATLYPEKLVRDVAGLPPTPGRELVANLASQAGTYGAQLLLGNQAVKLEHQPGGRVHLGLADGSVVDAGAVVITAGLGSFEPRRLPAGEEFLDRGLTYVVTDPAEHAGRDVVVVGGGDSAVDWALAFAPIARSTTLVHRRARFRAHAASVAEAVALGVQVVTDAEVTALTGDDRLHTAHITERAGTRAVPAQTVVAALGFVSDLGPLADWGLDLRVRHIVVDERMRTNLPNVYAAGDIAEHDGKVRLMSVGFGEVATAVNNAAVALDPGLALFPGHSTDA